jgi:hypothetical protein
MNPDIRVAVDFWDHPKTIKLEKRLGFDGPRCLQRLWMWASNNRTDGVFSDMSHEDIEIAAKWPGESGSFVAALIELRWAESDGGIVTLHSWKERNPWNATSLDRSDKARLSRMAKTHPELYKQLIDEGKIGVTKEEYVSLTTVKRPLTNGLSPAPAPAPAPAPQAEEIEGRKDLPSSPRQGEADGSKISGNGSGYTPSFEAFWSLYPLKKGKGAAFKAWKAVGKKKSTTVPQIMAALKAQVDSGTHWRGKDGENYIPHPTTWLNQACWEDEIKTKGDDDLWNRPLSEFTQ